VEAGKHKSICRELCPTATLSTTNITPTDLEINLGLHCEGPVNLYLTSFQKENDDANTNANAGGSDDDDDNNNNNL